MHIVQLLPELNQGGVERGTVELSGELVKRGHQSTVISAGGKLAEQIEKDGGRHITLDVCSKNPLTFFQRAQRLETELLKLNPEILHVHSRIPAWLCHFANKTLRIPLVTTVHGFNHVSWYSRIMTQGDAVICVSHPLKKHIQQHYDLAGRNPRVIPCGVNLSTFDPAMIDHAWISQFKSQQGLTGKYIVTHAGRITPLKDHETFIRGICACRNDIPNIRGLIVGDAARNKQALYRQLRRLVRELGADDLIVFAGSQNQMPEVYALSDVLVSSSKKPESFGLTLVESLAMNTPIIASRHGGVLDIIEEGKNGLLFTPKDPNELASRIIAMRDRPMSNLRESIVEKFSLDKTATETIAVYETLLNKLHVVQVLPELNQGGVERGTVELSRELVKRGHISTVISAGGSQAEQIVKDGGQHITLDVCSKNPFTAPLRILRLRKTLRRLAQGSGVGGRKVENRGHPLTTSDQQPATEHHAPRRLVLHARSRVPAWLCWFANKSLKIPFVTTVHGFNSVSKYSEIMTKGNRVIYGSAAIKEYILKHYPVDESKLRYVPRGIDTEHFDPSKADRTFMEAFKKQHGLEGKTIISIVGRITEWKGQDTFIRALAEVQKTRPDVVGVVAGGVWHDKQDFFQGLEKLAADLGANIRFVGSQTQVREIYALSDLVVSAASTKAETFGRTAAEALAMNTPVVASAHGGSLDILIDGENGLLFEPGNDRDLTEKIQTALSFDFSNPSGSLRINLRKHIEENFSLDRMTENELAVYSELV